MNYELQALMRNARDIAVGRGHDLAPFEQWAEGSSRRHGARAVCRHCTAWVQVETHPAPNSIDIGGPAIAEECKP